MTYHKVYNSKRCAVNQSAAIYARKTIIIVNLFHVDVYKNLQ